MISFLREDIYYDYMGVLLAIAEWVRISRDRSVCLSRLEEPDPIYSTASPTNNASGKGKVKAGEQP